MRKRRFRLCSSVLVLLLLLSAVAGCSATGGASSAGANASTAPEATSGTETGVSSTDKPITLTAFSWDTSNVEVNKKLVAAYKKIHPNVDITFIEKNSNYDTMLMTQIQSGSPPDLFVTNGTGTSTLGNLVDKGDVLPLDEYFDKSQYPDWLLRIYTIDGKVYTIPGLAEDGLGVFYNTKVFEKYGLSKPTSQEDFAKICDTLVANGVTPIAIPGKNAGDDFFAYLVFAQAYAADWNTNFPYSGAKFSDQPFIDAAKVFVSWIDKGYFGTNYKALDSNSCITELIQGKAAMFMDGEWNGSLMKSSSDIRVFYLKRPDGKDAGITSPRQNLGFSVYAKSPNKDAAVEFAKWYSTLEVQQMLVDASGGVPSTFPAAKGMTTSDVLMQDFANRDHSEMCFADTAGVIKPKSGDFFNGMSGLIQKLLFKEITPEEFGQQADKTVDYTELPK